MLRGSFILGAAPRALDQFACAPVFLRQPLHFFPALNCILQRRAALPDCRLWLSPDFAESGKPHFSCEWPDLGEV
jgi:hypothetical protein